MKEGRADTQDDKELQSLILEQTDSLMHDANYKGKGKAIPLQARWGPEGG